MRRAIYKLKRRPRGTIQAVIGVLAWLGLGVGAVYRALIELAAAGNVPIMLVTAWVILTTLYMITSRGRSTLEENSAFFEAFAGVMRWNLVAVPALATVVVALSPEDASSSSIAALERVFGEGWQLLVYLTAASAVGFVLTVRVREELRETVRALRRADERAKLAEATGREVAREIVKLQAHTSPRVDAVGVPWMRSVIAGAIVAVAGCVGLRSIGRR